MAHDLLLECISICRFNTIINRNRTFYFPLNKSADILFTQRYENEYVFYVHVHTTSMHVFCRRGNGGTAFWLTTPLHSMCHACARAEQLVIDSDRDRQYGDSGTFKPRTRYRSSSILYIYCTSSTFALAVQIRHIDGYDVCIQIHHTHIYICIYL